MFRKRKRLERLLLEMEDRIMSEITDKAAEIQASLAVTSAGLDTAVTGIQGIASDIVALKAKIDELRNSGTIDPADLAALNDIKTMADAIGVRATDLGTSITALDAETP